MAPPRRPWFRFYVEAIHDRKLRRLPPAQRWLWVVVLSVARSSALPPYLVENGGSGALPPLADDDLADLAALPVKDVRAGLKAFTDAGMLTLDDNLGALYVTKWDERQFESDDVSARTARHRSNRPDVATMERSKNGDGTPPETETETETEGVRASSQPQARGAEPIPDDDDPRIAEALTELVDRAERQHQADGQRIGNRTRWRAAVLEDRRAEHGLAIAMGCLDEPTWTPPQLADAVTGVQQRAPRQFHVATGVTPAPDAADRMRAVRAEVGR